MDIQELRKLYEAGLVSYKPMYYAELNQKVKQLIKVGLTKTEAVVRVKGLTGCSESTVWRACAALARL